MALARMTQRPASLAQMFGIEAEPGQAPSGIAFNDYLAGIQPTNEQRREAGVIDAMDARTNASMADDLAEADAVRGARSMGFEGSYPLQEQAQWGADQKLRQLLIPKQMELESKRLENETGREFNASQNELNRQSRERMATGAQAASQSRVSTQQNAITARANEAREAKRNPLSKLFGWLTGGSNEATPAAPTSNANVGGMVLMEAPTGEQQMVDAGRVQEFIAKGARVVE